MSRYRLVPSSAQEAVLFHADGREELILKINYIITGDTLPDRFAWVITVPNEPDQYEVADSNLFKEVFDWAQKRVVGQSKGKGRDKAAVASPAVALPTTRPWRQPGTAGSPVFPQAGDPREVSRWPLVSPRPRSVEIF